MSKNKELTKQPKVYYNGGIPIRHCGNTMAFTQNGKLYIHCLTCKKWVEVKLNK